MVNTNKAPDRPVGTLIRGGLFEEAWNKLHVECEPKAKAQLYLLEDDIHEDTGCASRELKWILKYELAGYR